MRILITGAAGQVGRCLARRSAARGYQVAGLTHADLDITDAEAVRRHVRHGDVVVNCAAMTNVDAAEAEPDAAHAINAVGPGNLAAACAAAGARLIHISTDYVFDGNLRRPYEITDACAPLSVYGRSKLDGEMAVHEALPSAQVVRTSWVYTGADGSDVVAVMRRLAATDRTIDMVADQIGSPTYVEDLVAALLELAAGGVTAPVLHVANDGAVSRFEQARAVFALLGADPARVFPVATEAAPRPARRPVYSALSMVSSVAAGLTPLRPWHDALAVALAVPVGHGPIASTP